MKLKYLFLFLALAFSAGTTQVVETDVSDEASKGNKMRVWSGVITIKIQESKEFYVELFGFEVIYDSDWFVLLKAGESQLGFMVPNHESQAPIFHNAFQGQGTWIAIDVEDVDAEYERMQSLGVPIEVPIRDEAWGDRHFVIVDPNGIGVDIVKYIPPTQ